MGVTLGVRAENAKCGTSIYRCTLDIKNRMGLSHYARNPVHVCKCETTSAKNEKLRYIAFFRSETQILNFLSRCFSLNKRDYFFPNLYGSKI